jgi:uncharacterized membrane protein
MTKISVVLSVSAGVLVGLCASAHADHWRVCNKTLEELFVAVGYHDKENQSISRGWGTVPSCRCINALTYDKTDNTNVYLYAENRAGVAKFTSDGPRLCVSNPGHFVYRNGPGNPCSGRVVGFDKVHLRTWPNVYTTNLESGDTCSMDPG